MMTRIVSALGLLLMAGCATPMSQELPATHPASLEATEAPPAEPSTVLALNAADPIRPGGKSMPGGNGTQHEHAGHGGNNAMQGAADVASAGARPASGEPLYMCPMHPKVTSTNPNDRCPECKMKINKLVKGASNTAATTKPATPAVEDHSAHQNHGGHGK